MREAGVILQFPGGRMQRIAAVPSDDVRRLAFTPGALLVATAHRVLAITLPGVAAPRRAGRRSAPCSNSPMRGSFRMCCPSGNELLVGVRRIDGDLHQGEPDRPPPGRHRSPVEAGPMARISPAEGLPVTSEGIPWPIAPNAQHPVGNTYGEYQNYGGAPYPHPGIDCMGSPNQPVYAVRSRRGQGDPHDLGANSTGGWPWRTA